MTTEEFSNEFDTLIDAYSNLSAFGYNWDPPLFNEYEKSVFLTKALEEIVIATYSTLVGNESFESIEETRRYLELLVVTNYPEEQSSDIFLLDSFKHTIFLLPEDVWFIIYELVSYKDKDKCIDNFIADVLPVTHDGFYRIKNNPFRGPSRRRVLRLDSGNNTIELVSKYSIDKYQIRYLKRPAPIILTDLYNLEINGDSKKLTCVLNTALHRKILERGVQLALLSRSQPTTEK